MDHENDRAADEALHWLIALQEDEDNKELRARLEVWLAADAVNREAWEECQHVWDTLGAIDETSRVSARGAGHLSRGPISPMSLSIRRKRTRVSPLLVGLTSAAVICLAVVVQPMIGFWLAADYSTDTAQTRDIKLEDGSTVYLGADSAISVSFESGSRHITLLTGEAYFDVAPNPVRPFIVETENVETRVLGTGFNVRRSGSGVNVAVNHGQVAVSRARGDQSLSTPLAAGDWVNVTWDGKVERGNDAPDFAGGWRSGMLVVKDRPVADVLDEIRRHYNGKILAVDGQLAGLRVTGVYDLKRPIEALNAVVQAHGIHVREVTPWVAVVSRW